MAAVLQRVADGDVVDHGGLHGDEDGRHHAERPCGRLRPRAGTGIGVVVASWGRQTTTGGT